MLKKQKPAAVEKKQLLVLQQEFSSWPYFAPRADLELVCDAVAARYAGEFCWSTCFEAEFGLQLMRRGFLPMACMSNWCEGEEVFLPKLHTKRCVLMLTPQACIPTPHKSTRRKARRFTFAVNHDFEAVTEGIIQQHGSGTDEDEDDVGGHCWIYPKLRQMFRELHARGIVHSFEVYEVGGKLAAGELGYCVGGTYTSLSGFSRVDSAGTVQMYCMLNHLRDKGCRMWDLGMEIAYKTKEFGASSVPRAQFLSRLDEYRDIVVELGTVAPDSSDLWISRSAAETSESAGHRV